MQKCCYAIGTNRPLAVLSLTFALLATPLAALAQSTIIRASLNNVPAPANGQAASISADGNLVAFVSDTAMVAEDTNSLADVYVRDITAGTTTLISIGTDNLAANAVCSDPAISADGDYIAFVSAATNLDGSATGGFRQVFRRKWRGGGLTTTRISVATSGTANGHSALPAITANGRLVAFDSFATNLTADATGGFRQVFLRDTTGLTTTLVSRATTAGGAVGNADSLGCAVSTSDGRFIAFTSFATNLVGSDTNNRSDVFVRDTDPATPTTTRVSVGPAGVEGTDHSFGVSLSDTGRYVAFFSEAQNLLVLGGQSPPTFRQAYVRDRGTPDGNGAFNDATAADPNRTVSVSASGQFGNAGSGIATSSERAAISSNGRFVAFRSSATNLGGPATIARADIYLHDRDPDDDGVNDEPGEIVTYRASATLPSSVTQAADCSRPAIATNAPHVFVTYETLSDELSPGDFNPTQTNVFRSEPMLCTTPSITSQPAANTSVCLGQQLSLTVVAQGAEPLAYQWKRNNTAIPGANDPTYIKPSATAGDSGTYTCVISNACGTITSDPAVVTVSSFGILVQPQPQNKCTGATATFSVAASGATAYQWRKDTVNLVNGPTGNGSTISNATASNLTITSLALQDAGSYDCVVTSTGCGTLTSNAVALTVGQAPAVTSQPADTAACLGRPFSLTITATGGLPLSYQWKKNGANIPNANNATYSKPSAVASDAGNYTCQVSNSCGAPATSNVAVVTVLGNPSITQQPATQTVCSGATASFSITAAAQSGLTYRWRRGGNDLNNGGNISGADTPTLFISPATTADAATNYQCVVTGPCGSTSSSSVALNINTGPDISQQPANTTVVSGDVATFRVTAGGSNPLNYQWRRNGAPISGATSATLNVNPATAASAGNYDCVVSNICGSITSQSASLTITGGGNPDPGNPDPGNPNVPNPSGASCGTCGAAAPQGLAMALMAMAWTRWRRVRRR